LYINVFVVAICGLVYELLAGTLGSYLLGDSITQFSLVIGLYLSAMGVGAWLSRRVDDDLAKRFLEIELAVAVVGGLSAPVLFMAYGSVGHFQVVLLGFVFAIGVLVGLEIPLLMRLLEGQLAFKDIVSRVLSFDYVGALAAAIMFPLVFVPQLGIVRSSLVMGLLNASVALWGTWTLESRLGTAKFGVRVRAVIVLVGLLVALFFADEFTTRGEERQFADPVVYTKTTPYQRILVTRNRAGFMLFLNGNLQFSAADEYRYHEALVHPAMISTDAPPKRVLVLGGGDGLGVREILAHPSVESVTLVDLDPAMTQLSKSFPPLGELNKHSLSDPRVTVINEDAMVWIEGATEKWDAIIVDFPDPNNFSLGKLYTRLFYRRLIGRLAPGGAVGLQATSPLFAREAYWCIVETMRSAGFAARPYHVTVPSFGVWGYVLARAVPFEAPKKAPTNLTEGLKYLNDPALVAMFEIPADMASVTLEINHLDNQALVRYDEGEGSDGSKHATRLRRDARGWGRERARVRPSGESHVRRRADGDRPAARACAHSRRRTTAIEHHQLAAPSRRDRRRRRRRVGSGVGAATPEDRRCRRVRARRRDRRHRTRRHVGGHAVPVGRALHRVAGQRADRPDRVARRARRDREVTKDGTPVIDEALRCRDPEERLFYRGRWYEGLYLHAGETADDVLQLRKFLAEVKRWTEWHDSSGKPAYAMPVSHCSTAAEPAALDKLSFGAWLDERGLTSERLRWLADYSCKDDYGLLANETSAWAGMFYFARARRYRRFADHQPILTWPDGNFTLVSPATRARIERGVVVTKVEKDGHWSRSAPTAPPSACVPIASSSVPRVRRESAGLADRTCRRLRRVGGREPASARATVGADGRADRVGQRDSQQPEPRLRERDPPARPRSSHGVHLVLPATGSAQDARKQITGAGHAEWAEVALADIERAHPDIRTLVDRIDVAFWGHGMIRPRVSSIFAPERLVRAQPLDRVHFAHTDLSGIALFEEAFDHGLRAAREVAKALA
jgi:spermidine synthase